MLLSGIANDAQGNDDMYKNQLGPVIYQKGHVAPLHIRF